ncbi:MAG: DUF4440 domain-containing protein [Bryobacteraceae bacterium]
MRLKILFLVSLAFGLGYGVGARRDDRVDLLEVDRAFDRATAERAAGGWVSFFAADGKMVRGNGEIVSGHTAIGKSMSALFSAKDTSLRWSPEFAEASKSGDLGYTVGSSRFRRRGTEGKLVESAGRYVTIWRKTGGRWKVALDIGASGPERPVE